ncbi:MAG: gamma-glutamyl-gamma-aminobutyrate hydrolase family protein [Armatimonadetes bacterium]|nr:gamma-glutamyl-gamma-aminobutyrate hydrolase family protein [Armatimonadota bacterium]
MKPVIGITADVDHDADDARTHGKLTLNWNYAQRIADAGGMPLVIPPQADPRAVLAIIDGWLIPGGDDIDSSKWGEELHPKARLQDPARYAIEQALFEAADPEMPILGICYGCQFLNVIRGGSLIQHLADGLESDRHTGGTLENVSVVPDSKLARIVGSASTPGKSYHHQGVGRLGDALSVSARHEDGTVEALEASDRPWVVGIQWHPERTDGEGSKRLFRAFVEACAAYAEQRRKAKVG